MSGSIYGLSQSANGLEYLKWVAVFGDKQCAWVVTAAFLADMADKQSEALKKAVLGARVCGGQTNPADSLTFRVSPMENMKVAKVVANNIIFSKDGIFPSKEPGGAVFIAGASLGKIPPSLDKKTFAEKRMRKIETLSDVSPSECAPISIDGIDGFESVASGTLKKNGGKTTVYQVMLFDSDGYYLFQGLDPKHDGQDLLPTFKKMARSFARVKSNP